MSVMYGTFHTCGKVKLENFIEGQALNEENKAKFISHQCVFYTREKKKPKLICNQTFLSQIVETMCA